MINQERLITEFLRLIRVNAPSRQEGALHALLAEELREMGAQVWEDPVPGVGEVGNLYAQFGEGGLLFLAHLDTVQPTAGISPEICDGVIQTDGQTILGADDRAGIAVLLEALRALQETSGIPPVTCLFTVAEEIGLLGAKAAILPDPLPRGGIALDAGDQVGTVISRAPSHLAWTAQVWGRAAHSGVEPEKGINAIQVASHALAHLPVGRVNPESTLNIGTIHGGEISNIVPDQVRIEGEIRSFDRQDLERLAQTLRDAFSQAAEGFGARAEVQMEETFPGYSFPDDHPLVSEALEAARALGLPALTKPRGGGSDANILNGRGLPTINLGLGMIGDHTKQERIAIEQLVLGAHWVLEILRRSST